MEKVNIANSLKYKWMLIGASIATVVALTIANFDSIKNLNFAAKNRFEFAKINPEFAQYIAAFTTGYISSGSSIKIKLTSQLIESVPLNTALSESYFTFDSEINGETFWTDAQTLEFKPKKRLVAGQTYKGTFYLHKLIDVKNELRKFEFSFKVVDQSLKLEFTDLKSYTAEDYSLYKSAGVVYTADFADNKNIEDLLGATLDGKKINIHWLHDDKKTTHKFAIDSIARGKLVASKLIYSWNGKAIETKEQGEKTFSISPQNTFELLNVQVINSPDQYIQIALSNPINTNQSLDGLIQLGEFKDLKIIVDNNHIRLYPNEIKTSTYKLKISNDIKDTRENSLNKSHELQILFEELKPFIEFAGKGVILPSSNGLSIPFFAVNLKAVDVKIVKLYENNVLQFLQNNSINEDYEIARVGKIVVEKTINLGITNPADFKYKKKFMLDLSSLLKTEPGAIYRISLNFKKSFSTYPCGGLANTENLELQTLNQ